jgi:hypothetical protein
LAAETRPDLPRRQRQLARRGRYSFRKLYVSQKKPALSRERRRRAKKTRIFQVLYFVVEFFLDHDKMKVATSTSSPTLSPTATGDGYEVATAAILLLYHERLKKSSKMSAAVVVKATRMRPGESRQKGEPYVSRPDIGNIFQ